MTKCIYEYLSVLIIFYQCIHFFLIRLHVHYEAMFDPPYFQVRNDFYMFVYSEEQQGQG